MFDVDVNNRACIPAAPRLEVMRAERDGDGGCASGTAPTQARLRADGYGVDRVASNSDARRGILQGTKTNRLVSDCSQ